MDGTRSLARAFDTDALEFGRGVEVGRLWEQPKNSPEMVAQNVMAENAEMMLRFGCSYRRPTDPPTWPTGISVMHAPDDRRGGTAAAW
jgi:hypothetical protein